MSAPDRISGRSFAAAQAFILEAKLFWTGRLYAALRDDYQRRAAAVAKPPETPREVAALVADTPLYRSFAWLERHLQQMKYSGRYGLHPYHDQDRDRLLAALDPAGLPPGLLELDPAAGPPDYYAAIDIHQHPGGIHTDPIAGLVYERGARTTTPLAGARHRDLHDRLVSWVEENGGAPRRLLDMGCGFGKSTAPFYQHFREAEVTGIDVSPPCLALAAREAARAQARNVRFKQRRAEATGLAAESVDLVTSTMLLHEMTPAAIAAAFDEAKRVLAPGGRMVHLDFHHLPDPFLRFVHYGHGKRNNEPYMEPFAEMDVKAMLEAKGFRNVRVVPFAEADGALAPDNKRWRFPWTVIAAEK
ncbi:MAG: methyltransferase domain-containing protein [Rhodospirillaceae bacterium]|nr:methyltransferase domain-containing protein [Rhodospirillaceae bacterium]